jgi:hypothetical protein
MGVWQGVSMRFPKVSLEPAMPNPSTPCGQACLKRPWPTAGRPVAVLLPPCIPHAIRPCTEGKPWKQTVVVESLNSSFVVSNRSFLPFCGDGILFYAVNFALRNDDLETKLNYYRLPAPSCPGPYGMGYPQAAGRPFEEWPPAGHRVVRQGRPYRYSKKSMDTP